MQHGNLITKFDSRYPTALKCFQELNPAFRECIDFARVNSREEWVFEGSKLPLLSQKSPRKSGSIMSSQGKASSVEYVDKPTDEAAQDLQKLGYTQEMTRVCRLSLKSQKFLWSLQSFRTGVFSIFCSVSSRPAPLIIDFHKIFSALGFVHPL